MGEAWQPPAQPEQLPPQAEQPPPPVLCRRTMWRTRRATTASRSSPTMMVAGVIEKAPFEREGSGSGVDGVHRPQPLALAAVALAEEQPEVGGQHDQGGRRSEAEAAAGEGQTKLVHHQGDGIGEHALVAHGEERPFGIVHLPLDGADGGEAGGAQQVEDQEGIGGQGGEVGGNGGQSGEVALLHHAEGVAHHAVEGAEHTHDLFLGDQTHDGGHDGLPGLKAQGPEEEQDGGADDGQQGVIHILHQAEGAVHEAQIGGDPDEDGGQNDDGAGPLDKGPAPLPGAAQDVDGLGGVIGGQLHDEGGGVAGKHLGFLQDDAGEDDGGHADEIGGGGHPGGPAEDGARDQAHDGHLGAAGDEGGGHDGHLAVAVLLNGAGGHDTGHAAAGADEHGDEGLAGQAEAAEDAVHDEGDAGHIAAVLQDAQHEEEHQHLGHKAQHGAHAAHDAVYDQAVEPVGGADAGQEAAQRGLNPLGDEGVVGPPGENVAHGADGDVIDHVHHHGEDGQSQPAVGDDAVDLVRHGQAGAALFDAAGHQLGDVLKALVSDDGLAVVVHGGFAGLDDGGHTVRGLGVQGQGGEYFLILLKELDGVPAGVFRRYQAGNLALNLPQSVLHCGGKGVLWGKMPAGGGHLSGLLGRGDAALALDGGGLYHRTAQSGGQLGHIDFVPVFPHHVHHVQGDDHGDAQLQKLGGEV